MMNFRSGNSKANIEYEAFKKKYDTKSFKTEFKQKYEAAIKEIKNNKGPPMAATTDISKMKSTKASIYTSQQTLIEYYVNAKLVDAELYTILIFNKLNEFAKIPRESADYNKIKALNLLTLVGDNNEVVKRNIEMFKLIESTLLVSTDADLHKNPEFIRLLVLLLTIRYYTYTIVDTIYQNGKNNIESIIKNITTMNNHAEAIQTIVDRIDEPSPIVNPDGSTTYPDGSTTYSDGRTTYPDGSTSYPDGRIVTATGITTRPDNTIVDADGTTINDLAAVADVRAQNAALKNYDANMPGSINNPRVQASNYLPQQPQQSGNFLGFDFSRFLPTGGGQIGGVNDDVVTILDTISRAQVAKDPAISQLVKYSTNLLCNALALLSVSISFPSIKSPSLLAIMPEVYTNITNYFINLIFTEQNLAKISSLAGFKDELIRVITDDNFANIISNITKISNIPNTNNTITTVDTAEPVVYDREPEDKTTILEVNAAHDSVRDLIDQQLAGEDASLIASAKDAGNNIITSYYSKGRLSADYTTEVATAIVSVFKAYKDSYSPKDIAAVCTIAADNSKHNTDYRAFVNKFFDKAKDLLERTKTKLATAPPVQLTGGGVLPENYNFEFNLQASIIKGIEGSTFFRLNNILTEPEVVVAKKEGGQRTQKNRKRNMNRGGTRRNINFNNSNNYNV
jgi:hypothetical protein